MSTNKHIDKICCITLAFVLLLTVLFASGEKLGIQTVHASFRYENTLFDSSAVHTLDIVMDDWEGFLDSCENEEYVNCSLIIDNEAYKNVGIRAKGNTSLSSVAAYGNDRYSFKVEFDHYDKSKTYHGLDKLSLNNIIQDNTYMKDFLCYQMMGGFGVSAPLCSFVYITVNGEDWGLYLAVEGVEESFLARNYGNDYGELYKPDNMSMGGGRGNGGGFDMDAFQKEHGEDASEQEDSDNSTLPQGDFKLKNSNNNKLPQEDSKTQNSNSNELPQGDFKPQDFNNNELPQGDFKTEDSDNNELPQGDFKPQDSDNNELPQGDFKPQDFSNNEFPQGDFKPQDSENMPGDFGNMPQPGGDFSQMEHPGRQGDTGPGNMSKGSSDVSLIYSDDEYGSYTNIFDNAKTDVTDADKDRLIASLKTLNGDSQPEAAVDIEAVIRYFVVHNFVCNFDSYTGSMIHNYYLYEKDGQLSMIPWDYNLAFGGFENASDASSLVNYPIDTPVSGGTIDSRPMLAWIFSNETYTELYHQYFYEFLEEYFENGYLEEMIASVSQLIAPYVEKDPTKFCTYEEFQTGISALKEFCTLRAESIAGQLNGTIPSTSEGQKEDSSALIDADHLTISDMGSMGHMGSPNKMDFPGGSNQQDMNFPQGSNNTNDMAPPQNSDNANNMPPAQNNDSANNMAPPQNNDNANDTAPAQNSERQ